MKLLYFSRACERNIRTIEKCGTTSDPYLWIYSWNI